MKLSVFIFLFISFFFLPNAKADLSGRLQIKQEGFLETTESMVDRYHSLASLELDHKNKFSNHWRSRAQFLFTGQSTKEQTDQAEVFPKELYLEWRNQGWFTKVGAMTVTWEGTDGANPMDLFTVKDFRDPLQPQSLASGAFHTGWSNENHSVEAIIIPWQTQMRLPKDSSPWWPRRLQVPTENDKQELRLTTPPNYLIHTAETIDNALRANASLRWQWRSVLGDFSFAVFEGASPLPHLQPILNVVPIISGPPVDVYELVSPVEIQPIIYRVRSGGMSYVLNWDKWILRVAGSHTQPMTTDTRIPGWSQQYVAGLERSLEWGQDSVILLTQLAYGQRSDSKGFASGGNLFEQALMLGLRWPHGERWILSVNFLRDLKTASQYTGTQLTYRWSDEWSTDFYADVLGGPSNTLLGVLSNRDRVGFNLNRSF